MESSDPRKTATRRRLTGLLRYEYGVTPAERHDVAYAGCRLLAFHFIASAPRGTIVAFGGFDSYIEEFFPIFLGAPRSWLERRRLRGSWAGLGVRRPAPSDDSEMA